ncbi:MAG TPA: GNAT family N-acetyltransferase [Bdellovibrionota bacterium]|jgi:ElaA protein|nr:GNAT family N-acetyltransferase [Bdellovibrionota bacterium]
MTLRWRWTSWTDMGRDEIYAAIALRERVFCVEQNCAYLDADGKDARAWHLLGWAADGTLAAYARVTEPGVRYSEYSIGRVVTSPEARGTGAGRALMAESLRRIRDQFGEVDLRISAQAYLERFYGDFGFSTVRGPYLEDQIPHLEMFRPRSIFTNS